MLTNIKKTNHAAYALRHHYKAIFLTLVRSFLVLPINIYIQLPLFRKCLENDRRLAKRSYYDNLMKKNERNPSQTWSLIKDIIDFKNSKNKAKLPSTIMIKDEKIKTDSKKYLNIACKYFANIGANMSKKLPFSNSSSFKIHSKSCMKSFLLEKITLEEINFYSDNLKSNSSPGIDDLPPKFIKLAKCILFSHLVILFNTGKCIKQEIFPNDFKLAYVIPIIKNLVSEIS